MALPPAAYRVGKAVDDAAVTASPDNDDGLAWHLHTLRTGSRAYREYEANGNGGQFLIVVPELDLAVVFTAGNYNSYGLAGGQATTLPYRLAFTRAPKP